MRVLDYMGSYLHVSVSQLQWIVITQPKQDVSPPPLFIHSSIPNYTSLAIVSLEKGSEVRLLNDQLNFLRFIFGCPLIKVHIYKQLPVHGFIQD